MMIVGLWYGVALKRHRGTSVAVEGQPPHNHGGFITFTAPSEI